MSLGFPLYYVLHVLALFLDVCFWLLCPFSYWGSLALYALSFHNDNRLYLHDCLSQLWRLLVRRPQLCGVWCDEDSWYGDDYYYCDLLFGWWPISLGNMCTGNVATDFLIDAEKFLFNVLEGL